MYPYYAINATNKTNRCQWFVEQSESSEPAPKRMAFASKSERLFLSLLEIMTSFFTHQEMNTLGQMNQTWKKKITTDTKKYPYIDRTCSLLIASRIKSALYNSEAQPMNTIRLMRLANIARLLQITTPSCSHIHHFQWIESEYKNFSYLHQKIDHECKCRDELLNKFLFPKSDLSYVKQVVSTQIANHRLAQLNNFTMLHSLTLGNGDGGGPTDDDFAHLTCLAGTLKSLTVRSYLFTDISLKVLTQFSALKNLSLATSITDDGLRVLSDLTSLQSLSIQSSTITGVGLKALNQLNELKTLIFNSCDYITTANIAQLAHFPGLQNLSIKFCSTICSSLSREGIQELESFTLLRSLTFIRYIGEPITDHQLDVINKLTQLHSLNLSWSKSFARLSGLTALRTLTLSLNPHDFLKPKVVIKLINQHPNLQNLNISILNVYSNKPMENKQFVENRELVDKLKLTITSRRLRVIIMLPRLDTIHEDAVTVYEDVVLGDHL